MAKNEKKFPYMGGVIAYRPAGSFTDEDTKELKEYDAAVKIYSATKEPSVLTVDSVRALYYAIRDNKEFAVLLGIKTGLNPF